MPADQNIMSIKEPGPIVDPSISAEPDQACQRTVIDRTTPISDLPQFLTVDELAAYLDVGRGLAYEIARTKGVRVGRLLRVPREAIAALATSK